MPVALGDPDYREPDCISLCDSDECEESPVYNACFTLRLSGPTLVQESVIVSPDIRPEPNRTLLNGQQLTPVPHHYQLKNSNVKKLVEDDFQQIPNGKTNLLGSTLNGCKSSEKSNGTKESARTSWKHTDKRLNNPSKLPLSSTGVIKCKIFAENSLSKPTTNGTNHSESSLINGLCAKKSSDNDPDESKILQSNADPKAHTMDIKKPRIGKLNSLRSKFEASPDAESNISKPSFLKKRPANRESCSVKTENSSDLPANPYSLNVRMKSQIGGINLRKFGEPLKRKTSKDVQSIEDKTNGADKNIENEAKSNGTSVSSEDSAPQTSKTSSRNVSKPSDSKSESETLSENITENGTSSKDNAIKKSLNGSIKPKKVVKKVVTSGKSKDTKTEVLQEGNESQSKPEESKDSKTDNSATVKKEGITNPKIKKDKLEEKSHPQQNSLCEKPQSSLLKSETSENGTKKDAKDSQPLQNSQMKPVSETPSNNIPELNGKEPSSPEPSKIVKKRNNPEETNGNDELASAKVVNYLNKTVTEDEGIKSSNSLKTKKIAKEEDTTDGNIKDKLNDKSSLKSSEVESDPVKSRTKKVVKKKIVKVIKKKSLDKSTEVVQSSKPQEPSTTISEETPSKQNVLQDLTLTKPGESITELPQITKEETISTRLVTEKPSLSNGLDATPENPTGTADNDSKHSQETSVMNDNLSSTSDVITSVTCQEVSVSSKIEQINPNNEVNRKLNQLVSLMNGQPSSNRTSMNEGLISPEVSITEPPLEDPLSNTIVSVLPHPPSHLRESAELLVARVQNQKRSGSVPKVGSYYNSLKRRSKINRKLPTMEPLAPSLTGYLDEAEARLSRAIRSPLSMDREGPELFSREMSLVSTSTDTPEDDMSVSDADKSQASAIVEQTSHLLSETDILLRKSRSGNSLRRSFSRDMIALNTNKLYEMTVDLSDEQNASQLISERLQTEQTERLKLQKEVGRLQDDLLKMTNMNGEHNAISRDLEILRNSSLNGDLGDDGMDSGLYKKKYEWSQKEVELLKKQVTQLRQDGEDQFLLMKKQLEKKLLDAEQEAEEQRQVVAQFKKKSQKLTSEMNDIKILLEDQTSRNNLLEKKQRRFDQEIQTVQDEARKERMQKETAHRERDQTLATKYTLDQDILTLKLENELKDEKIAALKAELQELHASGNLEEETIMFKKIKNELEMKNKDLEEELDEMAGQVQMLEAAKIRLEMSIEQMRKENKLESAQRDQEAEEFRMSSQKKLRGLENQLEMQYDERSQLIRDKHELERKLSEAHDKVMSNHDDEYVHRLKRDLRKTKVLLRDTQTQLERAQSEGSNKILIRQLKTQLEDAEFARTAALKGKQIAEADVREIQSLLEDSNRSKKDAEDKALKIAKEKAEIYSQMEENEEELSELMKKYKTAVHQHSQDQIIMSEQTQQIAELEHEKQILQDKMLELSSKVEVLEGESANIHTQRRLQMKVKEVESKLELEHTSRHRFESQISRLKDQLERETSEAEANRYKETKLMEECKKLNRLLRETREDLNCAQQKNTESFARKQEVEKQLELAESEISTLKSDLKLAFKRIEDLQQALQGDISDSDSDVLDSGSDSDLSLSSYVSASANYRRSHSTGVSTGVSNSPSIERQLTSKDNSTAVLEDANSSENQPNDSFA